MVSGRGNLVLIISLSLLSQFTPSALGESTGTGMNVKDEPQNSLWWMKNQPQVEDNPPDLMATTDRLTTLIFNSSRTDLQAVYGNCYANPGNSTLFIVLTHNDLDTIAMYNAALDPPPSVDIVYRVGPATYTVLEGYLNAISNVAFKIPRDKVEVNEMGITENATIMIGIGQVTLEAVGVLSEAIRGLAPPELIFVRRAEAAVTTEGTVNYPIIGGSFSGGILDSGGSAVLAHSEPLGSLGLELSTLFIGSVLAVVLAISLILILARRSSVNKVPSS